MEETRDLFKKIRYKGNILCKDGHSRKGKNLTEAEVVKKRWQEYLEPYKKKKKREVLMNQITTMVWSLT